MCPAEKNCCFGFDMAKSVNFKLSGDEFFMKLAMDKRLKVKKIFREIKNLRKNRQIFRQKNESLRILKKLR